MYYYKRMPLTYILAGFTAIVIASATAFLFLRPGPIAPTDTWTSSGALFPWHSSETLQKDEPLKVGASTSSAETLSVPLPAPVSMPTDAFDELASLLADLVKPPSNANNDAEDFIPSSYAFIPQGLIGITTERPRTPEQQVLHDYGNALGLALGVFADTHPDMTQILKDQAEDRSDPMKGAAVRKLAADFVALADTVGKISAPPTASALQAQLAVAYRDAGEKLSKIPDASGDDAFLAAINTYNSSAETLSKRLIDTVDLFQSRGVTFSSSDPGSIFTFSANASF